ncbi:putative nucleoporin (NUP54/57) [Trypanosoma conorhini]|uniref:Putative nucleoporin (NUP54/57) n=1 Tax=Trypanosoma conorhini TaxID=83891 RepID=A0A422PWA9_9TRYP|nr:putative nucleoporin (NUP54/57) [Trypanosoma conorhini]RNF22031.1 putative nucleoporin (NUP54/57) [Trypanosoma conorhini]
MFGLGQTSAGTGFGTGTAATGGFGTGTAATGGFGTGTAATGGFGTGTAATGGFGTGTAATGGFGTGTAATGGFGTGTAATGGFGTGTAGFGGFGASKGFGAATTIGGQPQVPPYKGIKGPGFSTDWARSVNFSTLRDDVLFEELPPSLQQHLMELHNFIQTEHEAKGFVESFLADSAGAATATADADASSYRKLQKKLAQLAAGENAVDAIRVDCFERELQAQHLGMLLQKCEEEVVQYSKQVWEPLAEQDLTQRCGGNQTELPSEPFQRCLRDVQTRMEGVSAALTELELAVLPNAQRQKRLAAAGNASATAEPASSAPPLSRYTAEVKPLDAAGGLRPTMATHPIVQMNTTLSNELAALLNLAAWSSRLHARADAARDLFAHLYGASEAEVLLAQQQRQLPVGPKRPFPLGSAETSSFSELDHYTIGDIHRRSVGLDRLGALSSGERRMQYDVLLERHRQAPAPAPLGSTNTGFGAAAAAAGAAASAAPAAPAAPFAAATTTATATATATPSTAAGGFGASAPAASGVGAQAAVSGSLSTPGFGRATTRRGRT